MPSSDVLIVGGGLTGLALAHRLVERGQSVHVVERAPQLGGLTTWHDFGDFVWDRFYHVILPSDRELIGFLRDIDLGEELRWRATRTGYFVDEQFHELTSATDFAKFPLLSLFQKFRLAITILYGSRIRNWRKLERVTTEQWLIKLSGRATYEKFWRPLLLAKLGENYQRVSAVFIWSYIRRLFSARDSSVAAEHLGHVSGGYQKVFERLRELIIAGGGRIDCETSVQSIARSKQGTIEVGIDGERLTPRKVVFTGPSNVMRNLVAPELVQLSNLDKEVEYLGVVCMVLVTKQPLTPYYVLNIADARVPFTGVIGMSTVVDSGETAGQYLTYLPKYVSSTDALLKAPDDEIKQHFLAGLKILYPEFDMSEVVAVHINRAERVQPIQVIGFSDIVPKAQTLHPDFYVLNTAQFVSNTLNNNEVIRAVDAFVGQFGDDIASAAVSGANMMAAEAQQ